LPLEWSSGWLFEQMALLDANPAEWWKKPFPAGFYDEDEDGGAVYPAQGPPDGWQHLPWDEEVNGGE
jgi:hypothetical protein